MLAARSAARYRWSMQRASFVMLIAVAGCSVERTATRESAIIGPSHAAALGELPATGALLGTDQNPPNFSCTATLIAPSVVLTAGHCVWLGGVPSFTFERNAYHPPAPAIHAGAMMVQHPGFDTDVPLGQLGQSNDVGLVFLAEPITDVAPALLPRATDAAAIAPGLVVTLSGYGYADGYDYDAGVPGYAYKRVGTAHVTRVADYELAIEPANGDAGACNGDSGGPAYAEIRGRQRIAAVVSRGLAFMDCTPGGVFTRVDPYIAWIESQVTLPCNSGSSPDCSPGDDAGVADAAMGNDAGDDPGDDPGGEHNGDGGGCGCQSTSSSSGWLLLFVLLQTCTRRRPARSAPSG
jgi:hypothetical protein